MDRGAWQAIVCGVTRVGHDLVTKLPQVNFPGGTSGKEPTCQLRRYKRFRFNPCVRKITWRKEIATTPVFLPLVVAGGGYLLVAVHCCSLWCLPLLLNTSSRAHGFSICGSQALEHRLNRCGLVGSSWIRDQIHVSCIGKWILDH